MQRSVDVQALASRLQERFAAQIRGSHPEGLDPWIEVAADGLAEVCLYLRDEPDLHMDMLHCITGVDFFEPDAKKAAKVTWKPHAELVYHLSSTVHRHRLVLKVVLPRWKDDRDGQPPEVPSVAHVWRTADWHEREVFDLFGISFTGHPDLRRILLPEDWVGHPLRKDYQMPDQYHGIRGK